MRKIIIWYIMVWYIAITYVLHIVCGKTWKMFFFDISTLFSDSKEVYGVEIIIMTIIICIMVILTWVLSNHFKIEFDVKFKNKRIGKYDIITVIKKFQIVFWLVMIGLFGFCYIRFPMFPKSDDKEWEKYQTIAHAGGVLEEHTYSNCEEAILTNYENGQRVFEIDFCLTSDDKVVGKHDWEQHIIQEGFYEGYIPSEEEFLSIPLWGKYEPLSFERLCELMTEYPDIWIVTDSKLYDEESNRKFFGILANTAKESGMEDVLERIIIQVYHEEMKEVVEEIYPFKSWIFTLYMTEFKGDEQQFLRYVRYSYMNDIDAITMPEGRLTKGLVEIADRYGIKIYVHTINDLEEAQEDFASGINGIYTDSIIPSMLSKEK